MFALNSNQRNNEERLLIAEHEEGIDLSLYISADVMDHLHGFHPLDLIGQGKYSEFCLMLEGVSHFLYVVWNAKHLKKVTLLEMEMQAEIDKFVILQSLLNSSASPADVVFLRTWLFEKNQFDKMLTETELERYKQANYYAGKYCKGLQQQHNLKGLNTGLLKELRRFYRFVQQDKIRYINNQLH